MNAWAIRKGILNTPYELPDIRARILGTGFAIASERVTGNTLNLVALKPVGVASGTGAQLFPVSARRSPMEPCQSVFFDADAGDGQCLQWGAQRPPGRQPAAKPPTSAPYTPRPRLFSWPSWRQRRS